MEEMKHFIVQLETKEAGDVNNEMGVFEGYASVWGSVDLGGDTVSRGAFTDTINEWKSQGMMPQLLFYHDDKEVVGEWVEMKEDDNGLYVKGRLWIKGEERMDSAVKAYNILKSNSVKGLSIGYRAEEFDNTELMDGTNIRDLKKVKLFEVSIAPWSMEPKAKVTSVKAERGSGQTATIRELEKVLRDSGLCSKKQAQAILASGYKAIEREAQEPTASEILESLSNLSTLLEKSS